MLLMKIHKDFSLASIVNVTGAVVWTGVSVLIMLRCGGVGSEGRVGGVVFSTFLVGGGICGCPFNAITSYFTIPCFFCYVFNVGAMV